MYTLSASFRSFVLSWCVITVAISSVSSNAMVQAFHTLNADQKKLMALAVGTGIFVSCGACLLIPLLKKNHSMQNDPGLKSSLEWQQKYKAMEKERDSMRNRLNQNIDSYNTLVGNLEKREKDLAKLEHELNQNIDSYNTLLGNLAKREEDLAKWEHGLNQKINSYKTSVGNLEKWTEDLEKKGNELNQNIDSYKTLVGNLEKWEKDLAKREHKLNQIAELYRVLAEKVKEKELQNIMVHHIMGNQLGRQIGFFNILVKSLQKRGYNGYSEPNNPEELDAQAQGVFNFIKAKIPVVKVSRSRTRPRSQDSSAAIVQKFTKE